MALANVNNQKRQVLSGLLANRPTAAIFYGDIYYATNNDLWYIYTPSGWIAESLPAIIAGEAHLGEVGGWSDLIRVTPVITVGAYSAQDMVGGKITIPNAVRVVGGKSFLYDFWVICTDKVAAALDIHLFGAMAGAYADNGVESISAADARNGLGLIRITVADYLTKANFTKASPDPTTWKPIMLEAAAASRDIFAIVVCTATPTYTHVDGLQLVFGVLE